MNEFDLMTRYHTNILKQRENVYFNQNDIPFGDTF